MVTQRALSEFKTFANSVCRDMYYEKLGFMLTFWNLAGVPLTYCHCTLYLANHAPSVYRWNRFLLVLLYISYLFIYWIWDTTNSQKNNFRQQERGTFSQRKTFPQLPWQTVKNPRTIKTKCGDSILVDGWCTSSSFEQPESLLIHLQMDTPAKYITRAICTLL